MARDFFCWIDFLTWRSWQVKICWILAPCPTAWDSRPTFFNTIIQAYFPCHNFYLLSGEFTTYFNFIQTPFSFPFLALSSCPWVKVSYMSCQKTSEENYVRLFLHIIQANFSQRRFDLYFSGFTSDTDNFKYPEKMKGDGVWLSDCGLYRMGNWVNINISCHYIYFHFFSLLMASSNPEQLSWIYFLV